MRQQKDWNEFHNLIQKRVSYQQLKKRRDHVNYEALHKKYSKDKQDLDVFALGKNYQEDKFQETYTDENDVPKKKSVKKFPWQNMKP
jgi:hypothetical protein